MARDSKSKTKSDDAKRRAVNILTLNQSVGKLAVFVAVVLSGALFLPTLRADDGLSQEPLSMFRVEDVPEELPSAEFVNEDERETERTSSGSNFWENSLNGPMGRMDAFLPEAPRIDFGAEEDYVDDGRLFPNVRPFKRARERMLKEKPFAAPEPPTVDAVNLEKNESIAQAAPPVISLASANLPPLNPEGAIAAYDDIATRADIEVLREEMKEEAKGWAWQKDNLKITPYGFLNLSVSSDTQRAVPGEYILYVQNPDVDTSADFTIDARTSRLGLKIEGPRIERLNSTLGGVAEIDFQGTYRDSKNKGGVQLRRAYAELVDAQNERRLLLGQDCDVISSIQPVMLNYLPSIFAGNMGYRRAQIRFEQGWSCSSNLHLLGQIAAVDNVLGDFTSTVGVSPASAGWPVIEGRLAATLFQEARGGLPLTIGLSGHIGEQYYTFAPIAGVPTSSVTERKAIKTWSANFDFDAPVTSTFKIQGEFFRGSDLSSFGGGINQGVDLYLREAIDSKGWWVAAHKDWTENFSSNIGYGIDKPDKDTLVGVTIASNGQTSARTKNQLYFVNGLYNWTDNFMTGLEFSYWETNYRTQDVSGSFPSIVSDKTGKAFRTEFTTRLYF
ncbi:MAG: hypothetical protein ACOX0A_02240 [Thermoguttaceae bacterium]|jgi:hypothetical protein